MNLNQLKSVFKHYGCTRIYVKRLSPNDNSKNQVYLGGSFEVLNILPISQIETEAPGDWERERFKAKLNFAWIDENGMAYPAPNTQLILYPKYPEVRMSGFLLRCKNAPTELMTQRLDGRLLFLGVNNKGEILGYVSHPDSAMSREFYNLKDIENAGIFRVINIVAGNNRNELLQELLRINELGWIRSKRLDKDGNICDCNASNCGGYTLEAELGITPNGYAEPDYLGWEIKQFGVSNFDRLDSAVITLMTPEPNGGFYAEEGIVSFVMKYGYPDKKGRANRMNFGGVHKANNLHSVTNLTISLIGYDCEEKKIRNANGCIALIDQKGEPAATWSFASLLKHWNRKHNQACYVPSLSDKENGLKYRYGHTVKMGIGTDFQLFLEQMSQGKVYYDPGLKVENIDTKPKPKNRNQFRVSSKNLGSLYKTTELVNLNTVK